MAEKLDKFNKKMRYYRGAKIVMNPVNEVKIEVIPD